MNAQIRVLKADIAADLQAIAEIYAACVWTPSDWLWCTEKARR